MSAILRLPAEFRKFCTNVSADAFAISFENAVTEKSKVIETKTVEKLFFISSVSYWVDHLKTGFRERTSTGARVLRTPIKLIAQRVLEDFIRSGVAIDAGKLVY
ncbi:MAG: hypothetical protein EOP04_20460 [Proteobacteria bacterium]|nr:MAG: hypothetical protein EOP04_20460 [Pseudomonadota bacterium]